MFLYHGFASNFARVLKFEGWQENLLNSVYESL